MSTKNKEFIAAKFRKFICPNQDGFLVYDDYETYSIGLIDGNKGGTFETDIKDATIKIRHHEGVKDVVEREYKKTGKEGSIDGVMTKKEAEKLIGFELDNF